ncbi:MAG: radical SAM protein, partial [Lachnospiraceae bacterium]|nr:radical SAM protein [Lachnospiraceae bacterium]
GRSVTMSTCGLVPEIERLKEEDLTITLAVSLHAADDEKRKALMPVARKYSIKELIEACRDYYAGNKRRLTFEYSLIRGENDSDEDADRLSGLLKGLNCHVNLIPVNPVEGRKYREPIREKALAFKNKLEKNGINVTIRREMGRDISASCGQLRRSFIVNGLPEG